MAQPAQVNEERIEAAGRHDRHTFRQTRQDQLARLGVGHEHIEQDSIGDFEQGEIFVQDR